MAQNTTLVLGIGNTLLTDEGAGIHAMELLQADYADHDYLTFLDGGTLSFTLAAWIEDCDNLIVFDATQLGKPAGSVCHFVGTDMDEFLGTTKRSAHEVGLLDLMDIARITEHLPVNRALIGIQPETMGWGMQPTPAVQKALAIAVNTSKGLIDQWHNSISR